MEENKTATEIALIKKDLESVERLINKMDRLVEEIGVLSKTIALQSKTVENNEIRISKIENLFSAERLEETTFRKEQLEKFREIRDGVVHEKDQRKDNIDEAIDDIQKKYDNKTDELSKRIESLEKWKWWLMGIGAVTVSILSFLSKILL